MSSSDYTHLDVKEIKAETAKAFLLVVKVGRGQLKEAWVPKSTLADPEDYDRGDRDVEIAVRTWFVEKEDLLNA